MSGSPVQPAVSESANGAGPATDKPEKTAASPMSVGTPGTKVERASMASGFLPSIAPAFIKDIPLQDWTKNCFKAPELWRSLVKITGEHHSVEHGRRGGIVVAEDPLIGLATLPALGMNVHVPMRGGNDLKPPTAAGLEEALKQDDSVKIWRDAAESHLDANKTLLMRAWGTNFDKGMVNMLTRALKETEEQLPYIVCLMQSPMLSDEDLVIADTSGMTTQIVGKVIDDLQLLRQWKMFTEYEDDCEKLLDRLNMDMAATPRRILAMLNSVGHTSFRELLSDYQARKSKGSRLILDYIQADTENSPRHAASLFVASHFPSLAPSEFLQLADLLVRHTPAAIPGENSTRRPAEVTDQVLRECHISFEIDGAQRNRVCVIHFRDDDDDGNKSVTTSVAEVASNFDNHAPLLKERYMRTLALHLTLGHPSDSVAERYQKLEINALRISTPSQAKERLRRIVYGYPAFAGAGRDYVTENRRNLEATMMRALKRAPTFLNRLFDGESLETPDSAFTKTEAIGALCTAQPNDSDETWLGVFDEIAARLFWYSFASNPAEVKLDAYPAIFDSGEMMAPDRQARRQALLAIFRYELAPRAAGGADEWTSPLQWAAALRPLMAEIVTRSGKIFASGQDGFAADFLGDAAAQYLLRVLCNRRWDEVQPWPVGDDPARFEPAAALFAEGFQEWLVPVIRYQRHLAEYQQIRTPGSDTRLLRLSETIRPVSEQQLLTADSYRSWLLALVAMDGLTGSSKLGGNLEIIALSAFMRDAMGLADNAEAPAFNTSWYWEWLCDHEAENWWPSDNTALQKGFEDMLEPVWQAIPVLLLMAATQGFEGETQVFNISAATVKYLTNTSSANVKAPLLDVLDSIKAAQELQRHFAKVIGRYKFPPRQRDQWRAAFRSREEALSNLRRTLEPLRRYLYQPADEPAAS